MTSEKVDRDYESLFDDDIEEDRFEKKIIPKIDLQEAFCFLKTVVFAIRNRNDDEVDLLKSGFLYFESDHLFKPFTSYKDFDINWEAIKDSKTACGSLND